MLHSLVWLLTGVRPYEWVHVHQTHHRHTDTPADPHSPRIQGVAAVFFLNALLYRQCLRERTSLTTSAAAVHDAHRRRFLLRAGAVGPVVTGLVLARFTSVVFAALFFAAHTVTYLAAMGYVNAVGHAIGSAPHPNTARNTRNIAAVLLTAGESLHNNHHAHPSSARLANAPGELDPGHALIRVLARIGIVTSGAAHCDTVPGPR